MVSESSRRQTSFWLTFWGQHWDLMFFLSIFFYQMGSDANTCNILMNDILVKLYLCKDIEWLLSCLTAISFLRRLAYQLKGKFEEADEFGWALSYFTPFYNSEDGLIDTCLDLLYFVTTNFLIYYRLFEASSKEIVIEYYPVILWTCFWTHDCENKWYLTINKW